jgi:hypothetical protein
MGMALLVSYASAEDRYVFEGLSICSGDADVLYLSESRPYTLCTPAGRCSPTGQIFRYRVRCRDGRIFDGPDVYARDPNRGFPRVSVQSNAVVLYLGVENGKDVSVTLAAGYAPLPEGIQLVNLDAPQTTRPEPLAEIGISISEISSVLYKNIGVIIGFLLAALCAISLLFWIGSSARFSYIHSVLWPGERILARGKLHWIIYLPAALTIIVGLLTMSLSAAYIGISLGSVFTLTGLVASLGIFFKQWTTELVVTNHRVIHKTGFVGRHTNEMNMNQVVTVNVDQPILGRLLGYGTIHVLGAGRGIEHLHKIASPLTVRKAINTP